MTTPIANSINDILSKIHELRAVFVLGQRAVPFIEELFSFLGEISPLLDEINRSMRESTLKMPHATSQLQSVSQATELATTEILDLIDAVMGKLNGHKTQLEETAACVAALTDADTRILDVARAALDRDHPDVAAQIEGIMAEKADLRGQLAANVREQIQAVDDTRGMMNRIMLSLQVQDITTQQLASVNHLIESIRTRLERLVERLGDNCENGPLQSWKMENGQTYDAQARYDHDGRRQSMADRVVDAYNAEVERATPTDIDDVFAQASGDGLDNAASQNDIDDLFAGGGASAPASQLDIDQMFNPPPPAGERASQDDIDQLFGS